MKRTFQKMKEYVEKGQHFIVSSETEDGGSYAIQGFLRDQNKDYKHESFVMFGIFPELFELLLDRIENNEVEIVVLEQQSYKVKLGDQETNELIRLATKHNVQLIFVGHDIGQCLSDHFDTKKLPTIQVDDWEYLRYCFEKSNT